MRNIRKNITRIEEILKKNDSDDYSDLLVYTVNMLAIRDALKGTGELELSAAAAKLEQAGMDKDIEIISSDTPGFLDVLRFVIDKYTIL